MPKSAALRFDPLPPPDLLPHSSSTSPPSPPYSSSSPSSPPSSPPASKSSLRLVQDKAASSGDVASLVASVEGTIVATAVRLGRRSGLSDEDIEDLKSVGRIGAIEAARLYDVSHGSGASFNTYAAPRIKAAIELEIISFHWGRGRVRATKSPVRIFFGLRRVERAIEAAGGKATDEAVGEALGVPASAVAAVRAVVGTRDRALDGPVGKPGDEDEGRTVHDVVPDEAAPDAEDAEIRRSRMESVRRAMAFLDDRSRHVVEERMKGRRLREIGRDLGVNRERVRQLEARAVKALRLLVRE